MTVLGRGDVRSSLLSSVVAIIALLAVFAMHGPSSDHSMLMPAAHASLGAQSNPLGSPGSMADTPSARHDMHQIANRSDAPSLSPALLAADSHVMAHEDCVATLRSGAGHAAAGEAVVVTLSAMETGAADSSRIDTASATRAPPRPPDLDGLCISRT